MCYPFFGRPAPRFGGVGGLDGVGTFGRSGGVVAGEIRNVARPRSIIDWATWGGKSTTAPGW